VVEGLRVTTQFQDEVFDPAATPLSDRSYASVDSPMGSITGMMMSMGRSLSTAYVWLQATEKQLREARLHYKGSGGWEVMVDSQYPFEFTLALEDQQPAFEFWVEGVTTNGQRTQSEVIELRR